LGFFAGAGFFGALGLGAFLVVLGFGGGLGF
jgi:hypothetical protein